MKTKNESVGRDLRLKLRSFLRSDSGLLLARAMLIGAIGGAFVLVKVLRLEGSEAWVAGIALAEVLVVLVLILFSSVWDLTVFGWDRSAFGKNRDRRLEQAGRVCLARVVDLEDVISRGGSRGEVFWSYLIYRFRAGEASGVQEVEGRERVEPVQLVEAGRHPEPAMMVGEYIQVRYLPSDPSRHRVESLQPGPEVPETPPELPAVGGDEGLRGSRRP